MGQRVGWHQDKSAARQRLLIELSLFARQRQTRLTVVFDGHPEVNIADGSSFRSVKVFYAREGSDADHRIVEFVEAERNRQALCVVTSDQKLIGQVRASGVRVMRSGEFRKLLDETSEAPARSKDSTENLSEWMRYFGVDESDE